jgi:hypothetical protein
VVHDQHALLVQDAQVDGLPAGARQIVRPHQGAGPQLVHVQVAVAQAQQLRAQLVAPGRRVLLDEALGLQRAQDAVGRALGQADGGGDVREAQAPLTAREEPEHRRGPFERLDVACHRKALPPSVPLGTGSRPVRDRCRQATFDNAEQYRSLPTSC